MTYAHLCLSSKTLQGNNLFKFKLLRILRLDIILTKGCLWLKIAEKQPAYATNVSESNLYLKVCIAIINMLCFFGSKLSKSY